MEDITLGEVHRNLSDFIITTNKAQETILKEVKFTNGKVGELCRWRERMKGVWVALSVTSAVLAVVVPIIISVTLNRNSQDKQMKAVAEEVISKYIELE